MARLADFSEHERQHLVDLPCPTFPETPFAPALDLARARIAVISTAGLHRRADLPFMVGDPGYRMIPDDVDADDLVMSHISTNFDRTGFQLDMNMVLPLDRLRELVEEEVIGSVAAYHYSFMGATEPTHMEMQARDVAGLLKRDKVDGALLVPV
jgi:D-proline reductase (dithiol) PrdB